MSRIALDFSGEEPERLPTPPGYCEGCQERPATETVEIGIDSGPLASTVLRSVRVCRPCLDDARLFLMMSKTRDGDDEVSDAQA